MVNELVHARSGSGEGRPVADVLGALRAISQVRFTVREDPTLLRPVDVPQLVCNAAKLRAQCGWQPEVPFEKTMLDLLDYWRARVASAAPDAVG